MIELWTLAIAIVTAAACAIVGVFLVTKREALVSEALSHAVLPGILIAYIVIGDRSSPVLIVSAAASGLLMVALVRAIRRTGVVAEDASLGVVFAAMFSIGILVASRYLRNTNFHAHCIIDGNLVLAPLNEWVVGGVNIGPKAFWVMLAVLVLVVAFVVLLWKELKLMIFDPGLAASTGFRPGLLHLSWLGLVSLTTVAAFETAGAILVVALMIAPAAAGSLLSTSLSRILIWSLVIGTASAVAGYFIGSGLDVAPTGPMASMTGLLFLVALLFAPDQGVLSVRRRRRRQRRELHEVLLLRRVMDLDGGATISAVGERLGWGRDQLAAAVVAAEAAGLLTSANDRLIATEAGLMCAKTYDSARA